MGAAGGRAGTEGVSSFNQTRAGAVEDGGVALRPPPPLLLPLAPLCCGDSHPGTAPLCPALFPPPPSPCALKHTPEEKGGIWRHADFYAVTSPPSAPLPSRPPLFHARPPALADDALGPACPSSRATSHRRGAIAAH